MKDFITKIIEIGGINVLPFVIVSYAYWRLLNRFLDWQKERLKEQREILQQNHEVISDFTETLDNLSEEVEQD